MCVKILYNMNKGMLMKNPIHNMDKEQIACKSLHPSERTLNLIRQIAYTYQVISLNGRKEVICLN